MNTRLAKLRAALKKQRLEVIIVTHPTNRRYISGFTGSAGALLITQNEARIFSDFRYIEQVKMQAPDFQLIRQDRTEPLLKEFAEGLFPSLQELGVGHIAFESHHLSVMQHQAWQEILRGVELVPTFGLVEDLRVIKEPGELANIRRAAAITDQAYLHILQNLRPGQSERDLAWETESYMRTNGAQGLAFEMLIQAGPHAALPHWQAGDYPINQGEPLLIDMGARVDGYHADLTRTIYLGASDAQFTKIYDIVRRAQEKALSGIRPGMKGGEVDALARQMIEEVGYGKYFGHGLGHGVGLEIHERPIIRRGSEEVIQPGMVITVEPGIYLPGWGGVRVEDLVLVGEDGIEILSLASKDPWFR